MGGVVEEATRKGEVAGSNPTGRVACDFTRKKYATQGGGRRFKSHRPRSTRFYVKKYATCDFDGDGRAAFLRFKSFFLFL